MEHPLMVVNGTTGLRPKGVAGAQPSDAKAMLSTLFEFLRF
jgi:hypothetical protein